MEFFVPYGKDSVYSLYTAQLNTFVQGANPWRYSRDTPESFSVLFKDMQNYFDASGTPGEFEMVNAKENQEDLIEKLSDTTTSVLFGFFLAAALAVENRRIKEEWNSITVTGDIGFDKSNGHASAKAVREIDKKFEAFLNHARTQSGKHLFVYVADNNLDDELYASAAAKKNTVDIKRLPPGEDAIFDIFDLVFAPHVLEDDPDNLDELQRQYLAAIPCPHAGYYILTKEFHKIQQEMRDKNFRGYFIYGNGLRGKSTLAAAIARYILWQGKIHVPLWIKIENDKAKDLIQKKDAFFSQKLNIDARKPSQNITDPLEVYIVEKLYEVINWKGITSKVSGLAGLSRFFSENRVLIVFDNLELGGPDLEKFLSVARQVLSSMPGNKRFIIFTSRYQAGRLSDISAFGIWDKEVFPFSRDDVSLFADQVVGEHDSMRKKVIRARELNIYDSFIGNLHDKLRAYPGVMEAFLGLLRYPDITVQILAGRLAPGQLGSEDTMREIITGIFKTVYANLSDKSRELLFVMLSFGSDMEVNEGQIAERLVERGLMFSKKELSESLRELVHCQLIHDLQKDELVYYGMKNLIYETFLFEDYIADKELRAELVDTVWMMYEYIRHDQPVEKIEDILKILEQKGIDINTKKEDGITFFLSAAKNCSDPAVLELLRQHGADMEAQDKYGAKPIHRAAAFNTNVEVLRCLVNEYKADVHAKDNYGNEPIHIAAAFNTNEVLRCLINEYKADVHAKDNHNMEPIHYAAGYNTDVKVLQWLVSQKANIHAKDNHNMGPIHYAARFNTNVEVLQWLVSQGADINAKDNDGGKLIHHAAANNTNVEVLQWLVSQGADINAKDKNRCKPIHHAAGYNTNIEVLQWLFEHGADIHAIAKGRAEPIHWAAGLNTNIEVLRCLITEYEVDIKAKDKYGMEPIHYAARNNDNMEIIIFLLNNGAPLDSKDESGEIALHFLQERDDWDEIKTKLGLKL